LNFKSRFWIVNSSFIKTYHIVISYVMHILFSRFAFLISVGLSCKTHVKFLGSEDQWWKSRNQSATIAIRINSLCTRLQGKTPSRHIKRTVCSNISNEQGVRRLSAVGTEPANTESRIRAIRQRYRSSGIIGECCSPISDI